MEEKVLWDNFKDGHQKEVRDMIAEVLRAMSGCPAWWLALNNNESKVTNDREEVSRLSSVLGYGQDVLMLLFDIAGLVTRNSGGGYSIKVDKWISMFGEYELSNEISRNSFRDLFGGASIYYLRIGKPKSRFVVKEQMRNKELQPPRISKTKLSRLMRNVVSKVLLGLKSFDVSKGVGDIVDSNTSEGGIEEVIEAEVVDDLDCGDVDFDDSVSLNNKPDWMKKTNTINQSLFPILSRFGATISNVELSGLLSELVFF